MDIVAEKRCTKCGEVKCFDEFHKDKTKSDGRKSRCKQCEGLVHAVYFQANSKERLEYDRAYRKEHKQIRDRSDYMSKYYEKNKGKYWAWWTLRRTRKAGNGGSHTAAEWDDLVFRYGGVCLCCGSSENITKDHVLPISKGGRDDIENLQPLCMKCNMSKGVKHIDYRV